MVKKQKKGIDFFTIILALVGLGAFAVIVCMFIYAGTNGWQFQPVGEFTTALVLAIAAIATSLMGVVIGRQLKQQTKAFLTENTPRLSISRNDDYPVYLISDASDPKNDRSNIITDINKIDGKSQIYFAIKINNHTNNSGFMRFCSIILTLDYKDTSDNPPVINSYISRGFRAHWGMDFKKDIPIQPQQCVTTAFKFPFHYNTDNKLTSIDLKHPFTQTAEKIPCIYFSFVTWLKPGQKFEYLYKTNSYYFITELNDKDILGQNTIYKPPQSVEDKINEILDEIVKNNP